MKKYLRLLIVLPISFLSVTLFVASIPANSTKNNYRSHSKSQITDISEYPLKTSEMLTIVINEVAWGGTAASPFDEWIELYNNAPISLSVEGWRLHALDGGPDFYLQGFIEAREYYLIERTDDGTILDISADLIRTFGNGLNNDGDVLVLSNSSGRVIDTANITEGPWPNDGDTAYTMERVNPQLPDSDPNWISNNGLDINGLDANGHSIFGTPKARNSVVSISSAQSDLVITKQGPDSARFQDIITYTFTLSNAGNLPAVASVITDHFPAGTMYVDQSSPFTPTVTEQRIVWHAGTISVSNQHTWTLSLLISGTLNHQITNYITCTTSSTETIITNNVDKYVTQVGEPRLIISAVMFDGYQLNDQDEAIELANPTADSVDLAGWEICKSTTSLYCVNLPSHALTPGQSIWIAKDMVAFENSFGHPPDFELSSWINLANDGALLYLRDNNQNYIDTLVYGDISDPGIGWSGPTVKSYYNNMRGTAGQILTRRPDEETGFPVPDTNTHFDWLQNTESPLYGRRVWYPGWVKHPFFWPIFAEEPATVIVGIAPDNAFETISQTIVQAQHSISIEVYTFSNPHLLPLLLQQANKGVKIKILLEGNPVGIGELSTEWQTQLFICSEIERTGGECWFMIHDSNQLIYNRYEYIHTKMILIDNSWVILGSQNLTQDSLPADTKSNGTLGTRGCVIATSAPSVIARAQDVFARDIDYTKNNDLMRWNTGPYSRYKGFNPDLVDLSLTDHFSYTTYFTQPLLLNDTFEFETFTAPESALRQSDTLLGLVNQAAADDRILVEQMYEYVSWGTDPEDDPNIRLQAYISAARRGAEVRIFLNGKGFGHDSTIVPEKNLETVAYVNAIAQMERLNLKAALGNPTGGGVHNKMILVNLNNEGQYSHIGSINGSEGSNKVNREIAVQIESESLYSYLERLFELDWWLSNRIYMPVIFRNLTPPPPPVDHLVISEVYYSSNPAEEWIEIYNPTGDEIQLEGWKIGDAELPTNYEAMFQFPLSTTLPAQNAIVIAVNASEVYEADFEFYESDPEVRNMVPDPIWGTTQYPLSLRDAGDQVLFMDSNYHIVDSLAWGDATFPGIISHPGKINFSASLERYPPFYDNDNCLNDFRERYPPTPGEVSLE